MNIVKVPFSLPAYNVGDEVPVDEFMAAAGEYIREIECLLTDAEDKIIELQRQADDLKDQLQAFEENLHDYYRPRSAYEVRGLRECDF